MVSKRERTPRDCVRLTSRASSHILGNGTLVRVGPGVPIGRDSAAGGDVPGLETRAGLKTATGDDTGGVIGETWVLKTRNGGYHLRLPWSELSVGLSAVGPYCAAYEGLKPAFSSPSMNHLAT